MKFNHQLNNLFRSIKETKLKKIQNDVSMFKSTQLFKQSLTGKKFKQHNLAKFVRGDNEVNF